MLNIVASKDSKHGFFNMIPISSHFSVPQYFREFFFLDSCIFPTVADEPCFFSSTWVNEAVSFKHGFSCGLPVTVLGASSACFQGRWLAVRF